jgi:hypothetical protein
VARPHESRAGDDAAVAPTPRGSRCHARGSRRAGRKQRVRLLHRPTLRAGSAGGRGHRRAGPGRPRPPRPQRSQRPRAARATGLSPGRLRARPPPAGASRPGRVRRRVVADRRHRRSAPLGRRTAPVAGRRRPLSGRLRQLSASRGADPLGVRSSRGPSPLSRRPRGGGRSLERGRSRASSTGSRDGHGSTWAT